ncbi:MAG: hypothetical protein IT480_07630 [Gammaproteobacteria bacterium]|nr:hypothetical protein [Gammaproteobacteria bacterium]
MVDTVKIRQLRPSLERAPPADRGRRAESAERRGRGRLDQVVEDVKLALLTTGLAIENEKDRGSDPYNSRAPAKGRDTWSNRNRRR